jgi:hypothetical protein
MFLSTPLGLVRVPESLGADVRVDHVLVHPGPDALRIQLLQGAPDCLEVVAALTVDRPVAAQFLCAVETALADERPGAGTFVLA